jgi:hypothetical protein
MIFFQRTGKDTGDIMSNITKVIEKIPVSEKITIVYVDSNGFLTAVNTVVKVIDTVNDYKGASDSLNGLMIYHKPDGCRKIKTIHLPCDADYIVYRGHNSIVCSSTF